MIVKYIITINKKISFSGSRIPDFCIQIARFTLIVFSIGQLNLIFITDF